MKKNLIIHTGNLSIGGQEKMMIEFLNMISPEKYNILLLIEENKGDKNIYEKDIPEYVNYKFLTTENLLKQIEKYSKKRNFIERIIYSHLLMKKKKISINNFKKELKFSDIIIDYNLGLLRHINRLDLKGKRIIGWNHLGNGDIGSSKKRKNIELYSDIVTINREMEEGFKKRFPNTNVHMIPNFMDEKIIKEKSEEKMDETNLGRYILSVGALTEIKNHKVLIKSFRKIVDSGFEENLVILGEGKEKENLEKLIKELNLEKRVMLLGRKSNPYRYMKEALFYVQSSIEEGMPLVVMESMILGKAVLCTKNSGTEEIIKNSVYGLLTEIEENSIYEGLKKFIEDEKIRKYYEEKALERSLDFYKSKGQERIEKLIDVIEE